MFPTEDKDYAIQLWSTYMEKEEKLYQPIVWAMTYIDTFFATRQWDDLRRARSAVRIAYDEIKNEETPVFLTEGQFKPVTDAGLDVGFVMYEYNELANTKKYLLEHMQYYIVFLCNNVLEYPVFEIMQDDLANYHAYYECMTRMDCLETNVLCLELDLDKSYYDQIDQKYPTLRQGKKEWISDKQTCESEWTYLNETILIALNEKAIVSKSRFEAYVQILVDAQKTGTPANSPMTEIWNMPEMLPEPDWYYPMDYEFPVPDSVAMDGSICHPYAGADLYQAQYDCIIVSSDRPHGLVETIIASNDVQTYIDDLGKRGYIVSHPEPEEWRVEMPGYSVRFWKEDERIKIHFIGQDCTFCQYK